MIEVSGRSFNNGIEFDSNYAIVKTIRNKEGKIEKYSHIKKKNIVKEIRRSKLLQIILRIPVLRHIYFELFNSSKMIKFALFSMLMIDLFTLFKTTSIKNNNIFNVFQSGSLLIIFAICCIFIINQFVKIKQTWMYHGAEHKTLNAYRKNIDFKFEDVVKSSRVSLFCGTIYLIFLLLFFIIIKVFIPFVSLSIILAMGIASEIHAIENGENKLIIKYLYKLGAVIQKYLVTIEPNKDQMEVAFEGLKELLKISEADKEIIEIN